MARPQRRRPYRVVFTRPGERRSGTVVTADEATAHQEARVIARDGAVAEVQYVPDTGRAQHPGGLPTLTRGRGPARRRWRAVRSR